MNSGLPASPEKDAPSRATFAQAGIRIEKLEQFQPLRAAIERVFSPAAVERFLRLLQRRGVQVRDFERVLRDRLLEQVDSELAKSGSGALQLYEALTVSDKAQMREFYLTVLEAVDLPLREKYSKIFRYS